MPRELKFRAWNHELQIMMPSVDLSQPLQSYKWLGRNDYPIMQYTGMKDKNDVEIYEGDIVEGYTQYGIKILVVKFQGFGWYPFSIGLMDNNKSKVLGNIYQNKDMIH